MNPDQTEGTLRGLLGEMQRSGELSPQVDVHNLSLQTTLEEAGFDSVARLTLAVLIEERLGVILAEEIGDDRTTLQAVAAMLVRGGAA